VTAKVEENDIEPRDERIEVADGLSLRVLRWEASTPSGLAPFLLSSTAWVQCAAVGRSRSAAGRGGAPRGSRGPPRPRPFRQSGRGYGLRHDPEDLRALIAALGFDRPVIAGQSWGAGVVLDFGVRIRA